MSKVISFRLSGERLERLNRVARSMNRTPGEAAAILVEEGLRMREFPAIEFRDTGIGRQAYVRGHRLPIWLLASAAREYEYDIPAIAAHCNIRADIIAVALDYAKTFANEIDAAIRDTDAMFERLAAQQPHHVISV